MGDEHDKIRDIIRLRGQRPLDLAGQTTALIVVDVQRNFVDSELPFLRTAEHLSPGVTAGYRRRLETTVLPTIGRLVDRFRTLGLPIAFTGTGTPRGDGSDLPAWLQSFDEISLSLLGEAMWPAPRDRSWAIEPVVPHDGEFVVNKTSSGAFATTELEHRLREAHVRSVVVTGLTTEVCVATTAREAADRGFDVVVVSDGCTALSDAMHEAALEAFALAFGAIRPAAAVLEALGQGRSATAGAVPAAGRR